MSICANQLKYYSEPWAERQIRHLIRRTLFGVTRADYDFFKEKSMEECVEILLSHIPLPPPPGFKTKDDPDLPEGSNFVFAPYNKEREEDWMIYIKAQWAELMINPQRNITEKMVLFWHNHFPIQFETVMDSRYTYRYVNTLRKHATGNFKTLLREITTDPAMLVFLNGNSNNKTTSNENYGRELQELFTIGKGADSHYTEDDVKAAAKVLTGWRDDKDKINSYFDPASHNTEDKVFSAFYNHQVIKGRSGDEGATETDELIEMICKNPEVSKFLCRKLYRWFVHSIIDKQVEKNVIVPLSEIMLQSNYEVKPVLKALFTSAHFYQPGLIGATFKSPVDYFIGIVRELDVVICNHPKVKELGGLLLISGGALNEMGQNIGDPPSVAGWTAYYEFPAFDKNWVMSEYLSARNKWIKDISYFEGLNPLPEPFLEFDFIGFVKGLSNPGNAKALVAETLHALLFVPIGNTQTIHLQELLNGDKNSGHTWAELWSAYQTNPFGREIREEVHNRLRKVFNIILLLPEYQIM